MPEKTAARPWTPTEEKIGSVVVKAMSVANTWVFRATGGRWGARFMHGAPVLLLTTSGRKSGEPRVAPLIYLKDGDRLILVASKGGMSHHPAWYLNLEANPDCEVELPGTAKSPMRAARATDDEKARLWPRLCEIYPDYDDYQARTTRNIPVLILTRR
ncbi:MAG: nitroreductase family deazaflavin-dependent oxidoreductase [Deltaproteobacteria bacterium]|nr:nitroreductase family deazaflavin-dependent oxidoreductase [Deltaproteobacteria bacterium]